ncbi:unnamed protein product, partial [marine sediment metagenome]
MIDPKLFRNDIEGVAKNLNRRKFKLDIDLLQKLEEKRKEVQQKTQALQTERNSASKNIGQAKAKGEDIKPLLDEVAHLGDELKNHENELNDIQLQITNYQLTVPNLIDESVPDGNDEADNKVIREWGSPKDFSFKVKDHIELGEQSGLLDFEAAAKLSGARFNVLHGNLARLHRALAQFMLDLHINEHGYTEQYVPYLVLEHCLYGTGQLPKFAADHFTIGGDWEFSLIPTAEVPLTNLVRDSILKAEELPLKFVAQTPCFRSEAGSYGKDTRGMI